MLARLHDASQKNLRLHLENVFTLPMCIVDKEMLWNLLLYFEVLVHVPEMRLFNSGIAHALCVVRYRSYGSCVHRLI